MQFFCATYILYKWLNTEYKQIFCFVPQNPIWSFAQSKLMWDTLYIGFPNGIPLQGPQLRESKIPFH